MRALHLFLALGFGVAWISCGGSGTDNLFPGAGGAPGAAGNVTGASGTGSSGSKTGGGGSIGASGSTGAGGSTGPIGTGGSGGKGSGGAAGQSGTGPGTGGAAGTAAQGGSAGAAGSATAGMGGAAGSAVVDAGSDASSVPDAGTRPRIRCGNTTCNADTHFCCLDNSPSCVANGTDGCRDSTDQLHCDDATDCAPNQHCCAAEGLMGSGADAVCRTECVRAVTGRRIQILCTDEAQCPAFDPTCSENGQSIFASYSYCH